MSNFKKIFNRLNTEQRDVLMSAFNDCSDAIVILEDGKFIGCNIKNTDNLVVMESTSNGWQYGHVKGVYSGN